MKINHKQSIEDGSFLRLNNVTIGYTIPVKVMAKLKMSKIRLYATGNNLAILTKYTGYDPETNAGGNSDFLRGVDFGNVPIPRTYKLQLNVTF